MELTAVDVGGNLDVDGRISVSQTIQTISISSDVQSNIHFNVRDPIESFTGRDNYLTDLHQLILKNREDGIFMTVLSQTSVVTGLGGVGKTETVRKYIHTYGRLYKHVVWIDSEQRSTAESQLKKLATVELKLSVKYPDNKQKPFVAIIKEIYQQLCQDNNLLLIVFDNAEGLEDTTFHNDGIKRFLPQSLPPSLLQPAILVTSRNREWGLEKVINLDVWSEEECVLFVLRILELEETDKNEDLARKLGERFGRLPLAMQVAVGVIRQQSKLQLQLEQEQEEETSNGDNFNYGIQDLLDDYENEMQQVLENQPFDSSNSKMTMMVLWNITLKKIENHEEGAMAITLLEVMSYLSPVAIPKELICELFPGDDSEMDEMADALILLTGYSLVENYDSYFAIHRVIQDVMVTTMEQDNNSIGGLVELKAELEADFSLEWEHWSEPSVLFELCKVLTLYLSDLSKTNNIYNDIMDNAIQVANRVSQKLYSDAGHDKDENWFYKCTEYIALNLVQSHPEYAKKLLERLIDFSLNSSNGTSSKETQHLQLFLGTTLRLLGKFNEALEKFTLLYQEQKEMYGMSDSDTLQTKYQIAAVLGELGNYDAAMKLNLEILEREEENLGCADSHKLDIKDNISWILVKQRKYNDALKLCAEVLECRSEAGTDISVLTTKVNMATIKAELGEYIEPLQELNEALNTVQSNHGKNHPMVLIIKYRMVLILKYQGRYNDAIKLCSELLQHYSKVLSPNHPDVLRTKSCSAGILMEQGNYDLALEIFTEVVEEQSATYGASHVATLVTKYNLGECLCRQGKYEDALKLFMEVKQNLSLTLGNSHPSILQAKGYIARIYSRNYKFDEALEWFLEVLKDAEEILGVNHPETIQTKHDIALTLKYQGKLDDALNMFRQVKQLSVEFLGSCHPVTLEIKYQIAQIHELQGRKDEALKLQYEVLDGQLTSQGPNNPSTLMTKTVIADILDKQGNHEEALKMHLEVLEAKEKHLGLNHPDTLETRNSIACVCLDGGKYEEALAIFKNLLPISEKDFGPSHEDTIITKFNIAETLQKLERYEESLIVYLEVLDAQKQNQGSSHISTLEIMNHIDEINYSMRERAKTNKIAAEIIEVGTDFKDKDSVGDLWEKSLSAVGSRRWFNWCAVFFVAGVLVFSVRRRLK